MENTPEKALLETLEKETLEKGYPVDEDDGYGCGAKDIILNKVMTAGFFVGASSVLFHKSLYLLFIAYVVFFFIFPIAYTLSKFMSSGCINREEILDRGMDMDTVMEFGNGRSGISTVKFVEREILNANFWLVVVSSAIVCLEFVLG